MNLYHKKQRWKIALLTVAVLLVAVSLWSSSRIVSKVQEREIHRIEQWADAVKRKSELVNLTNTTFDELGAALRKLKERERQKVEMWSLAMGEINKPLEDYSFVVEILRENSSIPMIITDAEERVVRTYYLERLDAHIRGQLGAEGTKKQRDSVFEAARQDSLKELIAFWRKDHPPLEMDLFDGERQKVFYFDSIQSKTEKLNALEHSRDSVIGLFTDELVANEYLVPVVFIDRKSRSLIATNKKLYSSSEVSETIEEFSSSGDSIVVDLGNRQEGVIYYKHSEEVTQMKYFPFVQFFIIGLFVLIAYIAFSTFRRAEQDQVWAGMAKETAHQLGTPISSLMAWNQLLEAKGVDKGIVCEIDKDIDRLLTVTNRFSKIGSEAPLAPKDIVGVVRKATAYLEKRISSKIELHFDAQVEALNVNINDALIEWVIENIVKNAVDAIEREGRIYIRVFRRERSAVIDIQDTGRGIPTNQVASIFQPGYTTKKRGWGLGLSLVKRIVETVHKGKVSVVQSEVKKGTTFRIQLPL